MADRWLVSRVCEEFGIGPRAARRELDEDPDEVLEILTFRAYQRTKAAIDRAEKSEDEPDGPMADRVWEVTAALSVERRARRAADEAGEST